MSLNVGFANLILLIYMVKYRERKIPCDIDVTLAYYKFKVTLTFVQRI